MCKDGSVIPVETKVKKGIWSGREVVIGISRDITERKIMEQSIIDERDRANDANKAKSEFLANMSHEIRTPMNAILGFSEALYHKLESEQHRKMVKSVLSSGNLLLSLLNDILDLSKIDAGKLEISRQPVDLKNIIKEITLLFTDKAEKRGIVINNFIPDDFPDILMLDEIRINQVIFNLVGNAVKFTHRGYVNLSVSFIHNSEHQGELTIGVEDTGIGIAESQKEIIFEAFRQQSGQSNRLYGGVGLGLAISKRLIEKMNGFITLTSQVGKGSFFKVTIPEVEISNADLRIKDNLNSIQNITFEKASVLVVDDVVSNIEVVENLISAAGINVSSAENGEIALQILNHMHPDLILLDMRMPGMDGYEVAMKIKANPSLSKIPIIAFTASVFSTEKIENSGNFAGILLKPVNRSELFGQLARFLKHKVEDIPDYTGDQKTVSLENIPDDIKSILPQIMEALNQRILPKWETIKDQLVLFRIEEFANELKQLAITFNFKFLIDYADKIFSELEIVDLDALKETLNDFPLIIKKISLLIKT